MNSRDILDSLYTETYSGPILFIDPKVVTKKIAEFKAALPRVEINYAIKSNPHMSILKAVADAGCSFDVASLEEGESVAKYDPSKMVYSNPIRPVRYLELCQARGIKWYVVDSMHELVKVCKHVENPQLYIRLDVPNDKSTYSLAGKFGISLKDAEQLVDYCVDNKLALRGVSFHPGSQNLSGESWVPGIRMAKQLFHYMQYKGLQPDFLDIGGGFPAYYSTKIGSFDDYCAPIRAELADLPDTFRIVAEPGRYLCAEAGHLLSQVISTNVRSNQMWAYLDVGFYQGIIEAFNGFEYHTETVSTKPRVLFKIAGPTCDSVDVVSKTIYLPHNLEDGDFVVFQNCGAYSVSCSTSFNGFPAPRVVVIK